MTLSHLALSNNCLFYFLNNTTMQMYFDLCWFYCMFSSLLCFSLLFSFLLFSSLFPSLPFPSLPFPSLPFILPFPFLRFSTVLFPSLPFPSLPFPSLRFPSLPFPSLPFPSQAYELWYESVKYVVSSNMNEWKVFSLSTVHAHIQLECWFSDEGEDFPFSENLPWFLGFLLLHRGKCQYMLNYAMTASLYILYDS